MSWDELSEVLAFLAVWATSVTLFTELTLRAIERKRQEIEERECWRSLWHFPGSRYR